MEDLIITFNKNTPLYMQIYSYFCAEIKDGRIRENEALPSIRRLADMLSVSKITVERAYEQLKSEGYIESRSKSGFKASILYKIDYNGHEEAVKEAEKPIDKKPEIIYNFSSGEMDVDCFDFKLWQKYLNRAVKYSSRLLKYGKIKGEPELRREIARYIHRSRGADAEEEQIVIASNTQILLGTLCAILKNTHRDIAFEDPGFKNGRQVFKDYGYGIKPIRVNKDGISIKTLKASGAKILYTSPSHQFPTGYIMPVGKRMELLGWAKENGGIIIEDDYDSEFRYFGNPIPALKGLDKNDNVIYLGSFSKIIPPSIRISYMLLPGNLMKSYSEATRHYNQSASTAEQLALALFMEDGQLDRQIRRLRGKYMEKQRIFLSEIKRQFGDSANIHEGITGLFAVIEIDTPLDGEALKRNAEKLGCKIALTHEYFLDNPGQNDKKSVLLYFSGIPKDKLSHAVSILKRANS